MSQNTPNRFIQIKKDLNDFVLMLTKKYDFFVSITPVGSHAEPKEMETMNDLDVVVVFDLLDRAKWDIMIAELQNFATLYTDDQFGLILETRFGPFKMESDKPITVQIHGLFFDVQSFQDYAKLSPLVTSDWYRFPALYGKSLPEVAPIPFLTADDIIKARGGIDYSIEQLTDGVNIAVTLGFDDQGKLTRSIEKLPQNAEQKAEICFKSIKNILLNIWKLKTKTNTKATDDQLETLGQEILGADEFMIVKSLEKIYKRARAGEVIAEAEIADSQQKAKDILTLLKEYLERDYRN